MTLIFLMIWIRNSKAVLTKFIILAEWFSIQKIQRQMMQLAS